MLNFRSSRSVFLRRTDSTLKETLLRTQIEQPADARVCPYCGKAYVASQKLLAGRRGIKVDDYRHVPLKELVGQTVEGVVETSVDGAHGDEPCIMLLFTGGIKHGFVIATDSD